MLSYSGEYNKKWSTVSSLSGQLLQTIVVSFSNRAMLQSDQHQTEVVGKEDHNELYYNGDLVTWHICKTHK